MADVVLSKGHATEVRAGDQMFSIWESDDGGLYIEVSDKGGLSVTISDDGESEITATGQWLTIRCQKEE